VGDTKQRRSPIAIGMEWVARIFAVSLLMFLPGVAGQWLDERFGTSILALLGFGFGLVAGMTALLVMTKSMGTKKNNR